MEIRFDNKEMTEFLEKQGYTVKDGWESYTTRGYRGEYEISSRPAKLVYQNGEEIGNVKEIFEKVYKEKTLNL